MKSLRDQLAKFLLDSNIVSAKELEKSLSFSKKSGLSLEKVLLKKSVVLEVDLLEALSKFYNILFSPRLEIAGIEEFKEMIPLAFLEKYKLVPYSNIDGLVRVAINDPLMLHPLDELRLLLNDFDVIPVLAPESEIISIIHRYYSTPDETDDDDTDFLDGVNTSGSSIDLANEAPIIKMVNVILSNAVNEGVSDIHLEPQEKELTIRYRVDGILRRVLSPPKSIQNGIISRIKIMANMNIAENRLPQDGRINLRFGGKDIDVRVSSLSSQHGERIVMRLLNKTDTSFSIDSIGFDEETKKNFLKILKLPHGVILITGPTGSGKTSTLYAALSHINRDGINIITVEDPIEYEMPGINQVQARPKIGLTFSEGLRTILRQDPDVIMVGEIRDEETARVSSQAALTGHLVFSTLHTNDAVSAITRLIDMGIENYLVASTCIAFMAQRLVRVLCNDCKQESKITVSYLKDLGFTQSLGKLKTVKIFQAHRCKKCSDLGYKGRTGIYEFLSVDESIRSAILEKPNVVELQKLAIKKGMRTLRDMALEKVLEGITSLEEALRIT